MQKTVSLSIAACVALSGCSQPSSPWNTARAVRVDTRDAEDSSATYAEHLSGVLKSANVEHKIVTYEYRYRTALREEAIGTRTAVIYRDEENPGNPWWLMDERLYKPVWLPGEDESRQVSYYLHRPATVVSSTTIGAGDSKQSIGVPVASTGRTGMLARLDAKKKTERSRREPAVTGPDQKPKVVATTNVRKETQIRSTQQSAPPPAKASVRLAALFRQRHETRFDPASVTDQRKMEELIVSSGRRSAGLLQR